MLQELRVNNLALVDELHCDLSERDAGLVVLTGETGAGKSIILQALHLLGGGRGAVSWVRSGCEQADIEALFSISSQHQEVKRLLEGYALDGGASDIIIRRLIASTGKSKLYVNDKLVTARIAGELGAALVNIASQHDNQQLLRERNHLDLLDSYGELWAMRRQFSLLFETWQKMSSQLRELQEKEQEKEQHRDFLRYQLQEIESAQLKTGEDEQLLQERERLKASAALREISGKAAVLFSGSMLDAMVEARKGLEQLARIDPEATALADRAVSACFEVEDIEQELTKYRDSIPSDTGRLHEIAERLAVLKQLQRKYGPTLEEVLAFSDNARQELAQLEHLEDEITDLEVEVEKISTEVQFKAVELSRARKEAAERLGNAMEKELASLNFQQAVFQVKVESPEWFGPDAVQPSGKDTVTFLFSANPGEPPKSLARIASGGELSRLLLAMKCILARRDQVDTVIFDEVDAGIGGQAAAAVALKIKELAGHHQVLCITHLPQIAALADIHFRIEKQVRQDSTRTLINRLDEKSRVEELARMLGGREPTGKTLLYARELIEQGRERNS
ncbi:MAG: DNA repair protein RecN [Desulfobulbus propionicus]|nr:MAG: DNA repair protein RecN [Desulfobulbus propionicus]